MDFIKILLADTTFTFAAEIVLRSVLMYFLIILVLRFSGKRGVRQLSIFEIAIILSLGSALAILCSMKKFLSFMLSSFLQ